MSESLLDILKRREDLARVSQIFHSIQVGQVRKTFPSMKTQAKSSLLLKISSKTLTLELISLFQNLDGANEAHRVENGGLYKRG